MPFLLVACSDEKPSSDSKSPIDQWYSALKTSDQNMFNEILSEQAKVEILDLGVTQTKAEFIAALDEWAEASKELKLSYEISSADDTKALVEVCYEFPSNSFTNEEQFTLSDGKVISQIQQQIEEGC